jgi:hypothetical protein
MGILMSLEIPFGERVLIMVDGGAAHRSVAQE